MGARQFFMGQVKDGVLEMDDPKRFNRLLGDLEGERVLFTLCRDRDIRSTLANKWYWGCIIPAFMKVTGYEKDEAHDYLKDRFLEIDSQMPACEGEPTTVLTTDEHWEYCERIRRFLALEGEYVPDPGEQDEATA